MNLISFHAGIYKANCYVLYKDGEALVIDPGGSYDRIVAEASAVGAKIKYVLLTHAHFDHAGACARLMRDGAEVFVHENDAGKCFGEGNLARLMGGIEFEKFTPSHLLRDGDELDLAGYHVKVIHTPGHTSGSVCYLVEDAIFSGDTLFMNSVGRTDLPDGDLSALIASLKRLYKIEKNYVVYPGHLASTTLHAERDKNNFHLWDN